MSSRTPLGNLIQSVQDANGWSARRLEELAEGKPNLGKSNVSKLKNQALTSFKGETISGLAELLELPISLVATAALRSLKTPIELATNAIALEETIRIEPGLAETDKQTLLRMTETMRKLEQHERRTR